MAENSSGYEVLHGWYIGNYSDLSFYLTCQKDKFYEEDIQLNDTGYQGNLSHF